MEKIKQLLERYNIDVADGSENAIKVLRSELIGKLEEDKFEALLVHVKTYFSSIVVKDINEKEIREEITEEKTNQQEFAENTIIDQPIKIKEIPEAKTVERRKEENIINETSTFRRSLEEDKDKSLEELYKSYNRGNKLNKLWFTLMIILLFVVYITSKNIILSSQTGQNPKIILQLISLLLLITAITAYVLDRKSFKFRKLALSRILFIGSVILSLLGLFATYDVSQFVGLANENIFLMGIIAFRVGIMMGVVSLAPLYLSAFKNIEVFIDEIPNQQNPSKVVYE